MPAHNQTVVITGASSGIGKATALHLDQLGCRVFAGVRNEADFRALEAEASDALTPIFLDVTDEGSIETAVRTVTDASAGKVDGLINNADGKGEVSMALAGTGKGVDLGVAFGKFTIKRVQ